MGLIGVNGIRVFAYHGCLPEEANIGGYYTVDVQVEGDLDRAETMDELSETIDYGRVAAIVREEMAIRSKLIEHVAQRILSHLKREWGSAFQWEVLVTKEHPPIAGEVLSTSYRTTG